jgi:biotin carboxyl carrier protein
MTMPTYEIFVDDKPRKIELTKSSEKIFTVKVDEESVTVELQAISPSLEGRFSLSIDGKNFQIELPKIDRGKPFPVKVDGATFKAEFKTPAAKTASASFAQALSAPARKALAKNQLIEGGVTAPMTGKIVAINVKKGDTVKANQVLCIIEAMKMENEISSPRAGTVQEINVSEGSSVSEGDVLLLVG